MTPPEQWDGPTWRAVWNTDKCWRCGNTLDIEVSVDVDAADPDLTGMMAVLTCDTCGTRSSVTL